MALASLLYFPDDAEDLRQFFFDHAEEHLRIRAAIQKQANVNLPIYVLDPVDPEAINKFLEDHQSAHNDFNSLYNLPSNDLETVDLSDPLQRQQWAWLNYQEHYAICATLKI